MEDHCSPLSLEFFYQDEGIIIEELRHCLVYIRELEATLYSAKEEITRREFEMINLKDVLNKTIKERNEAQEETQKLLGEKVFIQQLLKNQQQQQEEPQQNHKQQPQVFFKQETPPPAASGTSSGSEESGFCTKTIVSASQFSDPVPHHQQPLISESHDLPEVILKLAADRPLPEKGKLLQAVKEAGPLLQILLLAGPLPQWQHPPPQLDSIEIPPVSISSPPAAVNRLIHQDSFNSCLSKKRGPQHCESNPDPSSPINKYQKVCLH